MRHGRGPLQNTGRESRAFSNLSLVMVSEITSAGLGGFISWEAGGGDVVDEGDDGDDQDASDDNAAAGDNDADVAVPDVVRDDAGDEPAFGRERALGLLRSRAKMAYIVGGGDGVNAPVGVDVDVHKMMLMVRMMVM